MSSENRFEMPEQGETLVEELMAQYWWDRLQDIKKKLAPDSGVRLQGADFDIARCEAYLDKIAAADFFSPVIIKDTYEGKSEENVESSVVDFFKNMGKYNQQLEELMKDDSKFLKNNIERQQKAREIVKRVKSERIDNN